MRLIKAKPSDHKSLSYITKKSKAYWGYPAKLLKSWNDVLTITPDYIVKNVVWKLSNKDEDMAYYSLIKGAKKTTVVLDYFFILPKYIGKGYGKMLLEDVFKTSFQLGYKEITLKADPNASLFYLKNGFKVYGKEATSVKGRFLPKMRKKL